MQKWDDLQGNSDPVCKNVMIFKETLTQCARIGWSSREIIIGPDKLILLHKFFIIFLSIVMFKRVLVTHNFHLYFGREIRNIFFFKYTLLPAGLYYPSERMVHCVH